MPKFPDYLSTMTCPCCASSDVYFWAEDRRREYYACRRCAVVFVPANFHLSPAEEKAEYDLHENDVQDAGYRRFLSRLLTPLLPRLPAVARGLDYGCGPGPALAMMLEDAGHHCAKYDLFYFPDQTVLEHHYDFITATEVVEHLGQPLEVLDRLWAQLNAGGVLAIMTKRVIDQTAFKNWHYKNDPTHIVFFADQTFEWLSERWQAQLEFIDKDVVFLTKNIPS